MSFSQKIYIFKNRKIFYNPFKSASAMFYRDLKKQFSQLTGNKLLLLENVVDTAIQENNEALINEFLILVDQIRSLKKLIE